MSNVIEKDRKQEGLIKEKKRRALKSLSPQEVDDLLDQGIQEFHNGGERFRFVTGRGYMVSYITGSDRGRTSAIWMIDFAKWCKGYVKEGKRFIKDTQGGYIELEN